MLPLARRAVAVSRPTAAAAVAATSSSSTAASVVGAQQKRFLSLHEYHSMEIMKSFGVPVPRGEVASTPQEAKEIATRMLADSAEGKAADVVIKAQVLAGGRGLGTFENGFHGGVHLCTSAQQAQETASRMLGQRLITKQTGEQGRPCNKVFLVERLYLRRELYLSLVLERSFGGPVFVVSPRGGTSIEDLAATSPELITKVPVDPSKGLQEEQEDKVVSALGLSGKAAKEARECIRALWKLFITTDANMLEVNPLAETPDGSIVVCDAKVSFDDAASFRQSPIFARRDTSQEDPREVEASRWDLNFIGLEGSVGCMVNGAGLAMATMDLCRLHGGAPANFLDVGGGASAEQITRAFEILNGDPRVQSILVNIFGGILRCDVLAQGMIAAAKKVGLRKPVVLRLQGTNVKEARALIDASGYKMLVIDDLDKAAETAVKIAAIKKQAEDMALEVSFNLPL